jgi:hypothetical protein
MVGPQPASSSAPEIADEKAVRRRLIELAIAAGASQVNAQFPVS